jgi:hypothetical protein
MHHIIPKSLGGTKTVPLCEVCHSKIHNIDFRNHGALTKLALQKKKEMGERVGYIPYGFQVDGKALIKNPKEQEALIYAKRLRNLKIPYRKICALLFERGYKNRAGKKFGHSSLYRILTR